MIVQSSDTPVGVRNLVKERQKYLFRSLLIEKSRLRKQSAFFSYIRLRRVLCTTCVICPSDVICASRVGSYKANIISLRNEVEQYHYELCE